VMIVSVIYSVYRWVCLSLYDCKHILKTIVQTSPNFLCTLPPVLARSSPCGVAIYYVLPVLWMTSCFFLWTQRWCVTTATVPPQLHARANTPAAWYWLCPEFDDGAAPRLNESFVQGMPGRSLRSTNAL